jgi:NAD dependent epimerase/dehydratase
MAGSEIPTPNALPVAGRRVLVTGAGGFIGSHLAERLVELGARVRALVHYNALDTCGWLDTSPLRSEMEIVAGDVTDRDSVRSALAGNDIVFHLAALIAIPYSYRAPASYVQANVVGTLNVMQAARDLGTSRVIHTSTSEVYGTARYVPIDEKHPLQGQSPYSASKIGADKIAESFHLSFGLPVVTVRPFNTYGPRQSARAVIPTIVTQSLAGGAIQLGNLHPTRDFNYVADTVAGFIAAATAPAAVGRTINLGTGREISIGDLTRLIARLTGRPASVAPEADRVRPEASEVARLCADNRLARELLNWQPATDLEQGLNKTIEWVSAHRQLYRQGYVT